MNVANEYFLKKAKKKKNAWPTTEISDKTNYS